MGMQRDTIMEIIREMAGLSESVYSISLPSNPVAKARDSDSFSKKALLYLHKY